MTDDGWRSPLALLLGLAWLAGVGAARTASAETPPGLRVEIDRGAVTLRARDVALKDLLAAIARDSGLEVDPGGPLEERTSVELEGVSMLTALRRVLAGRNFVLRYPASTDPGDDGVQAGMLWIFPNPSDGRGDAQRPRDGPAADLLAAHERLTHRHPGLASDDATARLAAVSALAASGEATDALAAAALFDADAAVREEAVHALGAAAGETGLRVLEQALADPALRVRRAAVDALADSESDQTVWALAAALRDEDATLREQAVYALGDVGGGAAISVLSQALADERGFVREAAAEVLKELSRED